MSDSGLPDDLDDDEVIYLDDAESFDLDEDPIGIEENNDVIDMSISTFTRHTKSIFATDLTKNGSLAVSGAEDDTAFVWSTSADGILFECTGHKDSVTCVSFNQSDSMVATGDMSGLIQVWKISDGSLVWCSSIDDLEWLLWHSQADVLFSGTQAGEVYVWQIPQGQCKILSSHGAGSTTGCILPDGQQITVGYSDGVVKLWNIKTTTVLWSHTDQTGITNIGINPDGAFISLAPSSKLLKMTDGKCLGSLLLEQETEIETQVFYEKLLVTGAISGQICVWDLTKQAIRYQVRIQAAVTVMKILHNCGKLLIGSANGDVYVFDVKRGSLLNTLTGHHSDIMSISVFEEGQIALTGSDDGTCKIFNM